MRRLNKIQSLCGQVAELLQLTQQHHANILLPDPPGDVSVQVQRRLGDPVALLIEDGPHLDADDS